MRIEVQNKDVENWLKEYGEKYVDPDGIKRSKSMYIYKDRGYYAKLAEVLQNRDKRFEVYLAPDNEPGIVFCNKKDNKTFHLKSDQFGFSAPSGRLNHPYDEYLLKTKPEHIEYAKSKIAGWIKSTRSIGGSFLWPMEQKEDTKKEDTTWNLDPDYNRRRLRMQPGTS